MIPCSCRSTPPDGDATQVLDAPHMTSLQISEGSLLKCLTCFDVITWTCWKCSCFTLIHVTCYFNMLLLVTFLHGKIMWFRRNFDFYFNTKGFTRVSHLSLFMFLHVKFFWFGTFFFFFCSKTIHDLCKNSHFTL